jgi:hypothetical protein
MKGSRINATEIKITQLKDSQTKAASQMKKIPIKNTSTIEKRLLFD